MDTSPRFDVRIRRRASYLALAAVVFVFVDTASLDVGYHGDEWYHMMSIQMTVAELRLAQDQQQSYYGMYLIPGYAVIGWHALPVIPQVMSEIAANPSRIFEAGRYPTLMAWQADMVRLISTNRFKSEVRFVFVLLTAPALLWVFIAVRRLFPNRYLAATAAAAFLGLSWEVSQRARCIEVDAPQMQFFAMEMMFICCALTAKNRERGLIYALFMGVAAGLVLGCKASGAPAILPVLGTAAVMPLFAGLADRLRLMGTAVAGQMTALYLVSPNTLRDPIRAYFTPFAASTDYDSVNPSQPPYVDVPFEHLYKVGQWFFLSVPSSNMALAVLLSVVVIAGLVWLWRRRPRAAALLFVYPGLTLLALSRLHLLQLRNNLQLVPLLAIGFGVGVALITRYTDRHPSRRSALVAALASVMVFNAAFLVRADRSVEETTPASILADVRSYVGEQSYDVQVSPRLHENLEPWIDERFECAQGREPRPEHRVLMYYTDHPPWRWKMYRIGFTERTFAPLDANYDWYSMRKGRLEHHRVVLLPVEHAREMNVATSRFFDCRRR